VLNRRRIDVKISGKLSDREAVAGTGKPQAGAEGAVALAKDLPGAIAFLGYDWRRPHGTSSQLRTTAVKPCGAGTRYNPRIWTARSSNP
jgi:hypothetical protein